MSAPAAKAISRTDASNLLGELLAAQQKDLPADENTTLSELGFSSLDLAEMTVRLEDHYGGEVTLDASAIRPLRTVGELLDLLLELKVSTT
jgi:acyl carrier protein